MATTPRLRHRAPDHVEGTEYEAGTTSDLFEATEHEAEIYSCLTGGVGFLNVHSFSQDKSGRRYLGVDRFGPDLQSLFNYCDQSFSLTTILVVAIQLISRLEYIHSQSIVYGEMKAENLAIGKDKLALQIFVTGFEQAERYRDPKTLKKLTGIKQTRRDDMKSLGRLILHFCKGLEVVPTALLHLGDDDKPNYHDLRENLRNLLSNTPGYFKGMPFDWAIKKLRGPGLNATPSGQDEFNDDLSSVIRDLRQYADKCTKFCGTDMNIIQRTPFNKTPFIELLNCCLDLFALSEHHLATTLQIPETYSIHDKLWDSLEKFLDLFRNNNSPTTKAYGLGFIYVVYSIIANLFEIAPRFKNKWIQFLGDLSRYTAVFHGRQPEWDIWFQVARRWYLQAVILSPTMGMGNHHLGICMRPDELAQLLYFGKSLVVEIPFTEGRKTIADMFELSLQTTPHKLGLSTAFVRTHANIFLRKSDEDFDEALKEFIGHLEGEVENTRPEYLKRGCYIGISNCVALLGYKYDVNLSGMVETQGSQTNGYDAVQRERSLRLFYKTIEVHLQRIGDINILSFLHATLVFIRHASTYPEAMRILGAGIPWKALASMLNAIPRDGSLTSYTTIEDDTLPRPEIVSQPYHETQPRSLPEERVMQGLPWTTDYFSKDWFSGDEADVGMHDIESDVTLKHRRERIVQLGLQVTSHSEHLTYDKGTHIFAVAGMDQPRDNGPALPIHL